MHLAYSPEQEALRKELRGYFAELMTPEIRSALARGELERDTYRALVRRLGKDGWLGLGWPKEYGGHARPLMDQYIFFDESQRAGVPVPLLSTNTIGPTLMRYGTEEQKQRYLPGILTGDVMFSIGYSEPGAGTDLASLQTRAERDGDHYVINGQKLWTSLIQYADYVWLACRTDPDASKHKGLSIIIVPTDSVGFSWTPVHTLGGIDTSATFYDDVRVPVDNIVSKENDGWRLITTQLNNERVAISAPGPIERRLEDVRRWASETRLDDGRRVIDQEWVRTHLAKVHVKLALLKLLNWKIASSEDAVNPADASSLKVFGSETYIESYRLLMEVLGEQSLLQVDSAGAVLRADLERAYRHTIVLTFGGGTNEIQRDIVAWTGLGLPRSGR